MIRFKAVRGTTEIVGFGLSRENIERLVANQHIHIKGRDVGLKHDVEIAIFFGETEADMLRQLQDAGMIQTDTIVRTEPQFN